MVERKHIYMHLRLAQDRSLLALTFVCTFISGLVPAIAPILTGRVFQLLQDLAEAKLEYSDLMHELTIRSMAIMITGFASVPFCWLTFTCWMHIGERQGFRVRRRLLNSYFNMPMRWYDENENVEGDFTQVNRCVEELRSSSAESSAATFLNMVTIIALMATSFYYSWLLTLVILASAPIIITLSVIFSRLVEKYTALENEETSIAAKLLTWSMEASKLIRLFGTEMLEEHKFNKSVEVCKHYFFGIAKWAAANQATLRFLSLLMFVQGFWFGNTMIKRGSLNVGQVVTCFSSCLALGTTLNATLSHIVIMQKGRVAIRKILALVESSTNVALESEMSQVKLQPLDIFTEETSNSITFDSVTFHYPSRPNEVVLKNVSIAFMPKVISFVVGKSGSGKSTLGNLLLKFYNDYEGTIKVGSKDIRSKPRSWLTDKITLVEQRCTLFDATVLDNILMAAKDENKNDEAVKRACQMALLEKLLLDLPDGIHTLVGSNGVSLSGGQQQRVALARAILRDPPILILDEAVSALDIVHRDLLMEAIRILRADKTTIIMTHELTSILDDDYLYLMEDGEVVEQGVKKALLNSPYSKFNAMCNVDPSNQGTPPLREKVPWGGDDSGSKDECSLDSWEPHSNSDRCEGNSKFLSFSLSTYFQDAVLPGEELYGPTLRGRNKRLDQKESSQEEETKDIESQLPSKERPKLMPLWRIILNMYSTVNKSHVLLGLIFAILAGAANPVFSYTFSKLLNGMVPKNEEEGSPQYLFKWSFIVIGVAVADGILTFLKKYTLSAVSEEWIMGLRKKVMTKIGLQELHWFTLDINKAAEISALVLNDLRDLRYLVSGFLSAVTTLVFVASIGVTWAFVTVWRLALVCIATVPLFFGLTGLFGILLQKFEASYKTAVAELENSLFEIVKGIRTIKCLELESHFEQKYSKLESDMRAVSIKRAVSTGFGIALSNALVFMIQALLMYYGFKLAFQFINTVEEVLRAFTLLLFTLITCSILMLEIPELTRGQRAATYIFRILNEPMKVRKSDRKLRTRPITSSSYNEPIIVMRNLSFAYPSADRVLVLKQLNLKVYVDEKVAIVGESGCGKSTLSLLLTGLYDVTPNSVYVDGTDICNWDLPSLRDQIAVVDQKANFLDGSIRENLCYGLLHSVSDYSIHKMLKWVGIADFVESLTNGLDTRIDTNLLSGGQAQRLTIARALLRNPQVLILDECTSALDTTNTTLISELVRSLENTTTIVITHSKQMMQICDRICYIDNGKVLEQGTYQQLLGLRGKFYTMVTSGEC